MVRAWIMDESTADQRLEHFTDPPEFLTLAELFNKTGVEYFKIGHENFESNTTLTDLIKNRGFTHEDEFVSSIDWYDNFEEKLEEVFIEHLHTNDEMHLVLEGSGYFDVRDADEKWIRIEIMPGDLIVIPNGIYHRFTLDMNNYIRAKNHYTGDPDLDSYNRPADNMDCRKKYLERLQKGFAVDVDKNRNNPSKRFRMYKLCCDLL